MEIGVISDTHDNVDAVKDAVSVFNDRGIDQVIHCGDFIAPPVIPFFEGFELHGVLGNNDGERDGLKSQFSSLGNGSQLHGEIAELEIDNSSIAVIHGEDMDKLNELIDSGRYDYVFYGHYHVGEEREEGDTTVINPGAHFPTVPEDNRTIVILDLEENKGEFINIADK